MGVASQVGGRFINQGVPMIPTLALLRTYLKLSGPTASVAVCLFIINAALSRTSELHF